MKLIIFSIRDSLANVSKVVKNWENHGENAHFNGTIFATYCMKSCKKVAKTGKMA